MPKITIDAARDIALQLARDRQLFVELKDVSDGYDDKAETRYWFVVVESYASPAFDVVINYDGSMNRFIEQD
jgi:hypothetical protein